MIWKEIQEECLKKRLREEEVVKAHLTMDLKLQNEAIAAIKKQIKKNEKEEGKRNERKRNELERKRKEKGKSEGARNKGTNTKG